MALFNWGKNKKEEAATIARIEENKQKQKELGEKLYTALKAAAETNKFYNVLYDNVTKKERVSENLGRIEVLPQKEEGIIYSVLVTVHDKTATHDPIILQASINVKKDKVHALYGAYGPEESRTINEFGYLLEKMIEHVKKWRLYK